MGHVCYDWPQIEDWFGSESHHSLIYLRTQGGQIPHTAQVTVAKRVTTAEGYKVFGELTDSTHRQGIVWAMPLAFGSHLPASASLCQEPACPAAPEVSNSMALYTILYHPVSVATKEIHEKCVLALLTMLWPGVNVLTSSSINPWLLCHFANCCINCTCELANQRTVFWNPIGRWWCNQVCCRNMQVRIPLGGSGTEASMHHMWSVNWEVRESCNGHSSYLIVSLPEVFQCRVLMHHLGGWWKHIVTHNISCLWVHRFFIASRA